MSDLWSLIFEIKFYFFYGCHQQSLTASPLIPLSYQYVEMCFTSAATYGYAMSVETIFAASTESKKSIIKQNNANNQSISEKLYDRHVRPLQLDALDNYMDTVGKEYGRQQLRTDFL